MKKTTVLFLSLVSSVITYCSQPSYLDFPTELWTEIGKNFSARDEWNNFRTLSLLSKAWKSFVSQKMPFRHVTREIRPEIKKLWKLNKNYNEPQTIRKAILEPRINIQTSCLPGPKSIIDYVVSHKFLALTKLFCQRQPLTYISPLRIAMEMQYPEITEFLLKHFCSRKAIDWEENWKKLLLSCEHAPKCLERLLTHNPKLVNYKNSSGQTPLMLLCHDRMYETKRLAFFEPHNGDFRAHTQPHPQSISVLCKFGADINAQDPNGNTPLHIATQTSTWVHFDLRFIQELLKHNPRLDIENKKGKTPLEYAKKHNKRAYNVFRKYQKHENEQYSVCTVM